MADSTKPTKNYVKGSSKEVIFANGGSVINLDLKIEGKLIGSKGDILPNEAGYVKIKLSKLDQPDQYGNTYSIVENDWKPSKDSSKPVPAKSGGPTPASFKAKAPSTDSLPF